MRNSMLIVLTSLIFIISFCTGCSDDNYSYKEEEISKIVLSSESNPAPTDVYNGMLTSPQEVNVSAQVGESTICDRDNLLMYGYELRLDKAVCYFAIPNFASFSDLVFTIEEYDSEGNLLNTVQSETMQYVGTYVAKVIFPSSAEVESTKICEYSFTKATVNFSCTNVLTLEGLNDVMFLEPISNTTFEYKDGLNKGLILLDENCVQIDMVVFGEDAGQFVTKQGVVYYKLVEFD